MRKSASRQAWALLLQSVWLRAPLATSSTTTTRTTDKRAKRRLPRQQRRRTGRRDRATQRGGAEKKANIYCLREAASAVRSDDSRGDAERSATYDNLTKELRGGIQLKARMCSSRNNKGTCTGSCT
ncbi:hypothetical protein HPB50_024033 [Hyalomma asiaticum]|uniref:Uncharacterized protein n=1 Tax=Hyalomma asiaticum TaxID=266040 RepID=A0ACB7SJZ6_HYAAI|nr:hypothetical protein HPB50_024033 [Hyalomma asiaticum]